MNSQKPVSKRGQGKNQESELAAIYQLGLAVASTLDLSQVLRSTVESAAKLLGADVVTLHPYDQAREEFVPPAVAVGASEAFEEREMPSKDGSATQIARTGKPMIANKVLDHPDISRGFIETEDITSSAGFPLKVGDSIVGVLFLNYHDYHKFTPEDIEKVTMFANQAAIAIRNAELFRQQEAATRRLEVLDKAKKAIDSATELEDVLDRILSEGLRIIDTERGSLKLIEGEDLITKAQFGPELDEPDHESITLKVGEGIAGYVAATGEAVLCPDVLQYNRFKHPANGKQLRFRSLLAVPIVSQEGRVIGVISADDPEVGHFEETHRQLLSDMAGQFANAIERMMLVETLHALHKIFERITAVAISREGLRPVLDEIARNAIEVLGIDVITIYQYDQDRGKFIVPPLMEGILEKRPMQTEVFEGEAPWVLVHKLKRHHYAPDSLRDRIMNPARPPGKGPGFGEREGIKSSAGLLLKFGEEIVGAMFVNYRFSHQFDDEEKRVIETFANSAAIALRDARQWESLKRTQDQLIQTAKMSAMGTLVGGVAHELKNPLSNILSSVNILEMGDLTQQEVALEEIKGEVNRASAIIDNLLGFVRPSEAIYGYVDVPALVNGAINLLANQAKLSHVNIESYLMPVPLIEGNATLLKQVFFNIMQNAIEAMPDGGRLSVRTTEDNANVKVEVQDTGLGIPPDILDHIFDPFFTTKEPGQGIGLGLAISYRIVHDHRGDMKVDSKVGKGTTLVVTLPIGG